MVRYLLVDDRDGKVLAELASAQQAALLLGRLERNPHEAPKVSLVRLAHQQGSLIDITSMVSVRLLPPLVTRRARIVRSRDRPSRPPPSTRPPRA
jgi:acetylornithine/succinyldiaminopimelate/putrescine aminotransferase